ncbi:putative exo-beta-1,3-glucanase [Aspergillus japonicus CBS 114.51]|uniref:Putative exo-beta-1,3-glucanase n=1 Tax=Aspergillus japonicus CBS 114.51 TaxID=1448312 RepID=A0A8T8X2Z6_ASPJA|nr:putative exo-beta-1,3-glucanase [Aspergillus japonicus CBS 114.51]RAH82446.1 putative exo-beta-1,3-glucanase [Aspergillus japonicus CBS 114.51]
MAKLSWLLTSSLSFACLSTALPARSLLNSQSQSQSQSFISPTNYSSFNVDQWIPSADYVPIKAGIPFVIQNKTAQPWNPVSPHSHGGNLTYPHQKRASCGGPTPDSPSTFWYESITHNGESSFLDSSYKANYKVFRNVVTDYGADNTGATDASTAIQNAIKAGASNGPDRSSGSMGTTGQPAVVYLPAGTYRLDSPLQLYVGTVFVGDALNPPTLKASASFPTDHIIYGKDPKLGGTINFYIGLKNVIIDSTSVSTSTSITLLDWTVSQATQLTNVVFNMPDNSNHVGVTSQYDSNSNIILNDLTFYGGAIAMELSGQQWILKGININGANVGIKAGAFELVCQDCTLQNGATGIDASSISGSLTVIDSTANYLGNMIISSNAGGSAQNSIILDNVACTNSGSTVSLNGNAVLTGSVTNTWVHGNLYSGGATSAAYEQGLSVTTARADVLLDSNGKYFTMAPPTYSQYSANQFINIKSVSGLPVYGDGATDDTANINAILAQYAGCKIIYFPAGTYIVTDTILIPSGSIIIGDAYASAISATGGNFYNPDAPTTMVQVGNSGDVGTAQISDMLFTVADVLQGCKLVEVNIAGSTPGAVGLWNSHFRIGGAAGSKVQTNCYGNPDICKAAWGLLHLTATSSAYIENMWGWTADHNLDGNLETTTVSTGRGMLVEATKGTWLVGTAMEHNTLYQYNFEYASNVLSSFQQSETPYWQGWGAPSSGIAPAPWTDNLIASDPTFSECDADDVGCRMAFFERIRGSSNLFLYGGGVWVFFNHGGSCTGDCQANAIRILSSEGSVYLYGTNVKAITNIVKENKVDAATEAANSGGWGGVVAAYLHSADGATSSGGSSSSGSTGSSGSSTSNGPAVTGNGLNWYSSSLTDGATAYEDPEYYYCFGGAAANFPPFANWMGFTEMFDLNQQTSMALVEDGPIQGDIWNAIVQVSADAKVDPRLVLAVVMQESSGNVYVGCTNNGVENCGLMQAYAGSTSFDASDPQGSITQMIVDGTQGTSAGGGLVQWFNNDNVGANTGGNPYNVLRGYNSGSINFNDLDDPQDATGSYVSDIANRLQVSFLPWFIQQLFRLRLMFLVGLERK